MANRKSQFEGEIRAERNCDLRERGGRGNRPDHRPQQRSSHEEPHLVLCSQPDVSHEDDLNDVVHDSSSGEGEVAEVEVPFVRGCELVWGQVQEGAQVEEEFGRERG